MSNPLFRLFSRSPAPGSADPQAGAKDAGEKAALARIKAQGEELKAASQLLVEGRLAEFLAKLPKLERLEVLNPTGQSYSHEFLLEAAGQGSVEVVRALLARGVAVKGTGLVRRNNGPGDTALHAAAGRGQVEAARCLLEHGAEINKMNGWGETPLHCAVGYGQMEMMGFLLEHGAEINARQEGSDIGTPLWRAAEKLLLDGVKYLLEHGADPRLTNDAKKQTPKQGAHRGFEDAYRQFHRTQGEERTKLGARMKQYETLVQLLEEAERRLGPAE